MFSDGTSTAFTYMPHKATIPFKCMTKIPGLCNAQRQPVSHCMNQNHTCTHHAYQYFYNHIQSSIINHQAYQGRLRQVIRLPSHSHHFIVHSDTGHQSSNPPNQHIRHPHPDADGCVSSPPPKRLLTVGGSKTLSSHPLASHPLRLQARDRDLGQQPRFAARWD